MLVWSAVVNIASPGKLLKSLQNGHIMLPYVANIFRVLSCFAQLSEFQAIRTSETCTAWGFSCTS